MTVRSAFEDAALAVLSDRAHAPTAARTFATLYEFMLDERRHGACHMISAVAFVLLNEQNVKATLCLGEVAVADGTFSDVATLTTFDHSWIEINAEVYDIAIDAPLGTQRVARAPVMATRHIDNGRPADFVYGASSPAGLDAEARAIARVTLREFMDGFPDHEHGLWGIVVERGASIGVATSVPTLRERYGNVRWTLRMPIVSTDDARRDRNRRKRERKGRR